MIKSRWFIVAAILGIIALAFGACTSKPSPTPTLEVRDAAEARGAAISYLQAHVGEEAPSPGADWNAQDVTPPGIIGATTIEYTRGEWKIRVTYPIVPPENTVYEVNLFSPTLGWHWEGTVKPDGNVTETIPFSQITEEDSQKIAEDFVKSSPTFLFDGMEDTLKLVDTMTLRCPYCWQFIFEFDSRHAGYGDRTGQMLAQVITPHRAEITVTQLEVTSAIMDGKWDMVKQEFLNGDQEQTLSVAELLASPVYDTEVRLRGKVSKLGEFLCPCFILSSGGEEISVSYDLMVENDGTQRPAVDVSGVSNGDEVIVTGELKGEGGVHYRMGDFWVSDVTVVSQ